MRDDSILGCIHMWANNVLGCVHTRTDNVLGFVYVGKAMET
jgi:hypothetical protein